jgi:hypothetical protein
LGQHNAQGFVREAAYLGAEFRYCQRRIDKE